MVEFVRASHAELRVRGSAFGERRDPSLLELPRCGRVGRVAPPESEWLGQDLGRGSDPRCGRALPSFRARPLSRGQVSRARFRSPEIRVPLRRHRCLGRQLLRASRRHAVHDPRPRSVPAPRCRQPALHLEDLRLAGTAPLGWQGASRSAAGPLSRGSAWWSGERSRARWTSEGFRWISP